MEKNIADKIENLVNAKFPDNTEIDTFIKANEEYLKLLQEGLTSKRGFNIMTTEEIYSSALNYQHTQPIG